MIKRIRYRREDRGLADRIRGQQADDLFVGGVKNAITRRVRRESAKAKGVDENGCCPGVGYKNRKQRERLHTDPITAVSEYIPAKRC